MSTNKNLVLDSYAVLAYLYDQTGSDKVAKSLSLAKQKRAPVLSISLINLGEIYYITARNEGFSAADRALALVKTWPISIEPANEETTLLAARIKSSYQLSYADAFAVATALNLKAKLMTGDREFEQVHELIKVIWLT